MFLLHLNSAIVSLARALIVGLMGALLLLKDVMCSLEGSKVVLMPWVISIKVKHNLPESDVLNISWITNPKFPSERIQ